jgi:hypothetical protein
LRNKETADKDRAGTGLDDFVDASKAVLDDALADFKASGSDLSLTTTNFKDKLAAWVKRLGDPKFGEDARRDLDEAFKKLMAAGSKTVAPFRDAINKTRNGNKGGIASVDDWHDQFKAKWGPRGPAFGVSPINLGITPLVSNHIQGGGGLGRGAYGQTASGGLPADGPSAGAYHFVRSASAQKEIDKRKEAAAKAAREDMRDEKLQKLIDTTNNPDWVEE